jgi:6-phosphogluconolactonase
MKRLVMVVLAVYSLMLWPASANAAGGTDAVFAMTNGDDGNEVVMYARAANGLLTLVGSFGTGGDGLTLEPDDALGSQNPLILGPDGKSLFAVNAGSNSISMFNVKKDGLKLADTVSSGGDVPVSLTMHGDLLYVLNAGGEGNITGFSVGGSGKLTVLPGSTRSLDAEGDNPPDFLVSPAQVGFTPSGDQLVVTVKGEHPDHQIHVFSVDGSGLPSATPATTTSPSALSFGFTFDGADHLLVAEPFGDRFTGAPAPDLGAASSYVVAADDSLTPVTASVANGQTATCWIAITPDGRFAYTTNNGSGTISSYSVGSDGSLSLIAEAAAAAGVAPVDLEVSPDGSYLYNVNSGSGTVGLYGIEADGSLVPLGEIGGLPDNGSAVGIAVS